MKRAYLLSFVLGLVLPLSAEEVTAPASNVVAKVGSTELLEKQMRDDLGTSLYDAENQLYQLKKNWVDQRAKAILFEEAAAKAKMTRQAWEQKEIDSKITPPTEAEINTLIQRYGANIKGADQKAQLRTQVITQLNSQKRIEKENALYEKLSKGTPVVVQLQKPETLHVAVTYRPDDPMHGSKNAPVTIVEFTDFQCPYCKRAQETLKQVESAYKGKVKVIARQYPLPFHNRAKPAAEAALCAREQGKYWEYRDKLFASAALEDADLLKLAKEVGVNEKKFSACVTNHETAARMEADIAEGQKYGVRGTPHFFINGRPISGAQPFNVFDQAIKDELEAVKS